MQPSDLSGYETHIIAPLSKDLSLGHMNASEIVSMVLENQQLKLLLDASVMDNSIIADRLSEYALLLRDTKARCERAEAKCHEISRQRNAEMDKLDKLDKEMNTLREENARSNTEASGVKTGSDELKDPNATTAASERRIEGPSTPFDLEFKPVYRSPEDMMKTRFEILAQLPVPKDIPLDILKPIGIPERFTLHEFLLGSASGSLRNALSGYCAFTENTTMWCPQREEHGFYLTPLYKCDTGLRSNVIHRWMKIDIKARMPKPTECFYQKGGEWYYTGTYKCLRLEDLTPKEYDNLSQETRDALVKETLAGRKNATPQVVFETSQLYAAGALKVAVVGIQCIGFNRMLYSVALQQAQRFQTSGKTKFISTKDISKAVVV